MNYRGYASIDHKQPRRFFKLRRTIAPVSSETTSYTNPYRSAPTRSRFRSKITGFALLLILALWGKVLLTNTYFDLRTITITGTRTIDKKIIRETLDAALGQKRFFVFSQRNFFVLDTERLKKIITTQFPIEEITVTKSFPHSLTLTVRERLAFIIHDDGATYTLVDEEGLPQKTLRKVAIHEQQQVITRAGEGSSTSTRHYPDVTALHVAFGEYPVVYNQKRQAGNTLIDKEAISGSIAAYIFLRDRTDFATHHFVYSNDYQTLLVENTDGVTVAFNPFTELSPQLETFLQAWQRELRKEKKSGTRINARYAGRVYVEENSK